LARMEQELRASPLQRRLPYYCIAEVYAAFGKRDKVFEWLNRAYDERDWAIPWIKLEPAFDNYRSDPEFYSLLARMNL
ncbi:MAG TPA: hypothetical protein VJQ56_09405, partial [Blastocatellia bacterium]|nr:hypothetical protein [Blastocatellia bacterium]